MSVPDRGVAWRGVPFDDRWELDPETGCHVWQAELDRDGYGRYHHRGAHRFAWIRENGDVPLGKQLDHLCRNPACVNASHLEAVTSRENTLRGSSPPAINARKTHCPNGHEYTPRNTRVRASGKRDCRTCDRERNRLRMREVRAQEKASREVTA